MHVGGKRHREESMVFSSGEDVLHIEVLECAFETLKRCGIHNDKLVFKLCDVNKQRDMFKRCSISDKQQQLAVCEIMQTQQGKWPPLRRQLLQVVSAKQTDALRTILYHDETVQLPKTYITNQIHLITFDMFLPPCSGYATSFYFKVLARQSAQVGVVWDSIG